MDDADSNVNAGPGSPRVLQLVILLIGGPALAIGGCAAASHGSLNNLVRFGVVFLAGVALTVTGVIVGIRGTTSWPMIGLIALGAFAVLAFIVLGLVGG